MTTMENMFYGADSFNNTLCGDSWIESSASNSWIGSPMCPSSDGRSGLSGGAVAGIVIGVWPGLGLCISAAVYTAFKLKRRTLTEAALTEALLTEAVLTEALLTEAELTEAVLTEALLNEAVLTEAVLIDEAVLTD